MTSRRAIAPYGSRACERALFACRCHRESAISLLIMSAAAAVDELAYYGRRDAKAGSQNINDACTV